MAPNILESHYSKDLENRPVGIFTLINNQYFVAEEDARLYKVVHSSLEGSEHCGCLEVYPLHLEISEDEHYVENVAPLLIDCDGSTEEFERIIDEQGIIYFDDRVCARYVYQKCNIEHNTVSLLGAQMRGAYVLKDFEQFGITTSVYDHLLNHFGCVISDNNQTVAGASMWAIKFHSEGEVLHVYDGQKDEYLGKLTDATTTSLGHIVWSAEVELWENLAVLDKADFEISTEINCHGVVLYKLLEPIN